MVAVGDLYFRPGASFEQAVMALQRSSFDIAGAMQPTQIVSESHLSQYLRKCEVIERQLSNFFSVDTVDRLVRTQDYWALRSATEGAPASTLAVSQACERDRLRYHDLYEALRAQGSKWRQPSAFLVVPDTNMLVDDEPLFWTINWPTLLNSHIVRLVVPVVVIHELDRLKRQGNQPVAKAARNALKWLMQVLPTGAAKSANLTPGPQTTTIEVDVDQGPMRRSDPDGDIIRFGQHLQVISEQPTVLVTRDLGMRLRAEQVGVDARQLIDPPVLPPKKDGDSSG